METFSMSHFEVGYLTLWDIKNTYVHTGLFPQYLEQNSWNPCKFVSDNSTKSFFCFTVATLVGNYPPHTHPEKGESLEMELIINHAYFRNPPWKSQ